MCEFSGSQLILCKVVIAGHPGVGTISRNRTAAHFTDSAGVMMQKFKTRSCLAVRTHPI